MAGEDSTLINAGSESAHGQTRCAEERSHNWNHVPVGFQLRLGLLAGQTKAP